MDAESALNELVVYMDKMLNFCKKKKLHKDHAVKYHFILKYSPLDVITKDILDEIESYSEFWDYLIFEHKFFSKTVTELFVEENKNLPEDVKRELLNIKSIYSLFIVEEENKDKNEMILRRIYTKERYHIWTKALFGKIKEGMLAHMRLIKWRGFFFSWGAARVITDKKFIKKILAHESFLNELEEDIRNFLSQEKVRVSSRTYKRREQHLELFYDFIFKNTNVTRYKMFNKTLIRKYLKWLNSFINISDSFIKESFTSIKKFVKHLVKEEKLQDDPLKNMYIA